MPSNPHSGVISRMMEETSAPFMPREPKHLPLLISLLFEKNSKTYNVAEDFLTEVRDRGSTENPYNVKEWRKYAEKFNLGKDAFFLMTGRLFHAGTIERDKNGNVYVSVRDITKLNEERGRFLNRRSTHST
jgi:hypothetical protein